MIPEPETAVLNKYRMTEKRRPIGEQYSRVGMATARIPPADRVAKVADVCDGVVAMATRKCSPLIGPSTRKRKRAEIRFVIASAPSTVAG